MATEAQIRINLDANKADKSVKTLAKSIDASKKSTMSARAELKKLTQDLMNMDPASKGFQTATIRAGQLRDEIKDTQAIINATAGAPVENLAKGLSGVAQIGIAGAQGLTSAYALFGGESEQVMQTLVKLQALAGLGDTLKAFGGIGDTFAEIKASFGAFGAAVTDAGTNTAEYASSATEAVSATTDIIQSTTTATAATKTQSAANEILAAAQRQVNAAQKESLVDWDAKKKALDAEIAKLEQLNLGKEQAIMAGAESTAMYDAEIASIEGKVAAMRSEIGAQNASTTSTEANTLAGEANIAVKETETVATGKLTLAQKAQALAAKMTVGGWLTLALTIAAAGVAIYEYIEASGEEAEAQKKAAAARKAAAQAAREQREAVAGESAEFATLISRLKATNAGTKERETLIKQINSTYGTTLKNIGDETKFQAQLNLELAKYLEYQKAKYQLQKNDALIEKNLANQDKLRASINEKEKELQALTKQAKAQEKGTTQGEYELYKITENRRKQAVKDLQDLNDELDSAEKRFGYYGQAANDAQEAVNELTNGGTKFVDDLDDVDKKIGKTATDMELFEERLKSLGNAYTGFLDTDPTEAFGELDRLGPEIIRAETAVLNKQLEIRGTYGDEKLALEEQLRQASLALLNLQLEQELKMAGKNTEEKLKIEAEYALKRDDILRQSSIQVNDSEAEAADVRKTWLEMDLAERTAMIQSYVEKVAEIASQATDVIATFNENAFAGQQAAMDSYYEQEALALEGSLANKTISQEQYESDVREMDQRRREEQKQLDREAFERSKKIQIANATIAGVQAVLNAFASGVATPIIGPATGAIYAAIAAGFSAVQIGQIKAQPFTAARGGIVPGNGSGRYDTVDARLAPGEAVINAASTNTFLPVLNAINQMGGGQPLVTTPTSQITQPAGYQQPNEIRAYVVERDMTDAQARSARSKRNARLFR